MLNINDALKAIGLGLLVLFFAVGVVKTCSSVADLKRPEHALKLFVRFALAKAAVTYGLDLMLAVFRIVQGMVSTIITRSGLSGNTGTTLPQEIIDKINDVGFWDSILWAVTLLGGLFITVLSFIMILTVYSRMFKLYMYTAIAPVPLSSFAGNPPAMWAKLPPLLCRSVSGSGHHRIGLHHLLRHGDLPACGGSQCLGGDRRVELRGRAHFQPACSRRRRADE